MPSFRAIFRLQKEKQRIRLLKARGNPWTKAGSVHMASFYWLYPGEKFFRLNEYVICKFSSYFYYSFSCLPRKASGLTIKPTKLPLFKYHGHSFLNQLDLLVKEKNQLLHQIRCFSSIQTIILQIFFTVFCGYCL